MGVLRHGVIMAAALGGVLAGCTLSRPDYIAPGVAVGDSAFVRAVEAHTLSGLIEGNRAQVLVNGDEIFPAMLEAIRGARHTITFANFSWEDGEIAREIVEALAERCRAGVGVNVLVDAIGSSAMPKELARTLAGSGCAFARYHPVRPLTIRRVNHRNHRRVLVVDGRIGFTGGTGIGDKWTGDGSQPGHWRQTDVRVEGPIVRALQAAFVEDWREATTLLLAGDAYFPPLEPRGDLAIQSVKSSPASGATEAYLLFLLTIEAARTSIKITNPYFVPDARMARALADAARRGVDVTLITAGAVSGTQNQIVRKASQAHFGNALEAGVKIHEYGPAMLHAKTMVVDDQWVSIGSANLDNASFALNNELNVTFLDRRLARRLTDIFERDLKSTTAVNLDEWRRHVLRHLLYLPLIPLRDQL
jgi:cardiolipin synthase